MKTKSKNESKLEYYWACIGPTNREELDKLYPNGEGHLRHSIKEAFNRVTGHYANTCSSGWGCHPEEAETVGFAAGNDYHKELIVKSYITEDKKMPRHIRAWYLLMKEEGKV
jgi:hypothetical protein